MPAPAQHPPIAPFWLRDYPVREFGMFWHLDLEVKNGAKTRKKILALMKKHKGYAQQPVENLPVAGNFSYQQFSFRIESKGAQAVLDSLKKLGKVKKLSQKENPVPIMTDEVQARLRSFVEERERGRAALAQLPSVESAVDELLAHIQTAFISFHDSADRVLFNIVVNQTKP
jgi:hypothetical protein